MPRTLVGRACKLYRNTVYANGAPDEATPTWSEVSIIKDARYSITGQTADVTVRRHGTVKREETVLNEVSVDFDIRVPRDKLSSPDYVAFRDAQMNHTPIELALCNQDITLDGTEVFRVVCDITSFSEEQPLGDAVKISITAKATDSVNVPAFTETEVP